RGARSLLAVSVGGALALSGALLQVLFSNPLCEPYTLGISSGAAFGAVLLGAWGGHWVFEGMAVGSFLGAALFSVPLLAIAGRRSVRSTSLLLAGVMLGFFGSSLVALVMAVRSNNGITEALVWLLGDLSRATSLSAFSVFAVVVSALVVMRSRSTELDTLLLGEGPARSVGLDVDRLRLLILAVSSLLVGVSVGCSGMIGFVGLMVPHAVRRYWGSLHQRVLPFSFLWGGLAVLLADWVGRGVIAPRELPVGVVTALIGAPLYLFWFRGGHRRD
ncbi:MAG: hypothetical protein RJB38_2424, partial [Pseudomonadota bacterium]